MKKSNKSKKPVEAEVAEPVQGKDPSAVALGRWGGRKGGIIGGKSRAEKLPPERRREIAQKAAKSRWERAKKESASTIIESPKGSDDAKPKKSSRTARKSQVKSAAASLGSRGGTARAANLSSEDRRAIARKAAIVRWAKKTETESS